MSRTFKVFDAVRVMDPDHEDAGEDGVIIGWSSYDTDASGEWLDNRFVVRLDSGPVVKAGAEQLSWRGWNEYRESKLAMTALA